MSVWGVAAWCALAGGILTLPDERALPDSTLVGAAHDALRARRDLPWYDPDRNVLRRLDVRPSGDDARRRSSWASERSAPDDARWEGSRAWIARVLQIAAWVVLGGLLAGLVWALGRAGWRRGAGSAPQGGGDAAPAAAARLEDLPPVAAPDAQDLLAAARRCHAAGDFGRAIVLLYGHQLQQLDRHHLIRLAKGKTNRQYLNELRGRTHLHTMLGDTVRAFEGSYFGGHVLSRAQFEACWAHVDAFHRELESAR
ncbi:MAG: DUF4129 domain-containing protein [Pirellulaceae bacterium]|jgi:hypothetical protein|nr:DUF4129 domain-containing protein [Pirellulaceae bacterium]